MKIRILTGFICMLFILSGLSATASFLNDPPYVPSDPHPEDGATDIGKKTHLSWTGGDPDPGDKAVYDIYFGKQLDPELIATDLEKPNYHPGILENNTQYYWKVIARDEQGSSSNGPLWTFTTNDCDFDPPDKPSGPTRARHRHRYEYTTKIMNQNQDGFYYNFSWGDGNYSGWLGPYNNNERVRAEYQWEQPGTYQVQARARFMNSAQTFNGWTTGWSEPLTVEVTNDNPQNEPPNSPSINGQTSGKAGKEYEYKFSSIDPDGDDVTYCINWGCCGDEVHYFGPYNSGVEATASHSWPEQGTYEIKIKAIDSYDAESDWTKLEVKMPRFKLINSLFFRFLEQHQNMFPLLRQLLRL